ncbi:MAG: co-chaperone GroES family protein [Fimbriiglobus sp.]
MAVELKQKSRQVEPAPVAKFFAPIGDYLAVTVFVAPTVSDGGVMIPEQSQADWESPKARVVAVGPKVEQVKAGDLIICHPSTQGQNVRLDGVKLMMVRESQVAGVLDPAPPE